MQLNTILFEFIHQGAGYFPVLDLFFVYLTSYITYGVIFLVLFFALIVAPFRNSDPAKRLVRIKQGGEIALSVFVTWIIVWILKVIIAHPRPFIALEDIVPLVSASPFESFPSAHAALSMAVAIAVLPFRKTLGHILIAFAFIVALSRLYVGVHYPFDIGVGLLLGFLIPKFIHRVFKK